jgi:hypothetical protein
MHTKVEVDAGRPEGLLLDMVCGQDTFDAYIVSRYNFNLRMLYRADGLPTGSSTGANRPENGS